MYIKHRPPLSVYCIASLHSEPSKHLAPSILQSIRRRLHSRTSRVLRDGTLGAHPRASLILFSSLFSLTSIIRYPLCNDRLH
ncbi:hypothetical protein PENSPDRAFT_656899 [Peniophora sp. CONT]|nr:hypothetical protein PENSPDRAFT_656899 [Peniophora sp. CONT]